MKRRILAWVVVAIMGAMAGVATAESVPGWTFSITPYFWLPQLDGDVAAEGVSAPVDVSFSDTASLLNDLKGAFMLHGEAQHGDLSGWGDIYAMTIEQERDARVDDTDVRLTQYIGELGAGYALPLQVGGLRVEAIGGARYQMVRTRILNDALAVDADATQYWTDPFVGMRMMYAASQNVVLTLRGDVGGFGLGSDLALNGVGSANWIINEHWSAILAYRMLDIDYEDDDFVYDVMMDGPAVGVTYTF